MKVSVVNYEIIEKADIQIEGITLLLGPSNNGKSSFMRAIKSVLYGRLGDDYIRFGFSASTVSLAFEEHLIVRSKTKSVLTYYIDGEKYEKVGRTRPSEIESMFNFKLIECGSQSFKPNFFDPDEPLFLVRFTPSERFSYLSLIIEESKFGDIVRHIVDLNKAASKNISTLETQIKLLDDEIRERTVEKEKFADIVPYFRLIETIEKNEVVLDTLIDCRASLEEISESGNDLVCQMDLARYKLNSFVDLSSQITLLKRLINLAEGFAQTEFVTRIVEQCAIRANCVEAYKFQQAFMTKGFVDLHVLCLKEGDLTQLRDAYISLDKACEFLKSEISEFDIKITEMRSKLTECPLCGTTLDEPKKMRILSGGKK